MVRASGLRSPGLLPAWDEPGVAAFSSAGLLSWRLRRLLSVWFHDLTHLASRPVADRGKRLPER